MKPCPKNKAIRSENYKKWCKQQPCCLSGDMKTGDIDIVMAHNTVNIPSSCKGTANKNHDIWGLPMRKDLHDLSHNDQAYAGERIFEAYDKDRDELIIEHMTRFIMEGNNF